MTTRRTLMAVLGLLGVAPLVVINLSAGQLTVSRRGAIVGRVLAPDGQPVSDGSVRLRFAGSETEVSLDRAGAFRLEAIQAGSYELQISSPGRAARRVNVNVSSGRELTLPAIRLSEAAWIRVRVVAPGGDVILNPAIVHHMYERSGRQMPSRPSEVTWSTDAEGVTTVGPLPRGIFVSVIDAPPWARTRIPDVVVTGEVSSIDLGTIRLEPGVTLNVDVRDERGAPVPNHSVWLDDGSPLLPERYVSVLTDATGRARFERLASGPYRVRTRATRKCGIYTPMMERRISISSGSPEMQQRLAVSGVGVTVRLVSAGQPLASMAVSLSPDIAPPVVPEWMKADDGVPELWTRHFPGGGLAENGCGEVTDRDGFVAIRYVPAGPARALVQFANSTFVRRVVIPAEDSSVTLDVPQGIVSLNVIDALNGEPATGARITWSSAGAEIDARVPATGDILLEGIPDGPGNVVVLKDGYERFEARFSAAPPVLYTIALRRLPDRTLLCRAQDASGRPVVNAVVELTPDDPLGLTRFAGTDERGVVQFSYVSPGGVRLVATASGYAASAPVSVTVPPSSGAAVPLTLIPANP